MVPLSSLSVHKDVMESAFRDSWSFSIGTIGQGLWMENKKGRGWDWSGNYLCAMCRYVTPVHHGCCYVACCKCLLKGLADCFQVLSVLPHFLTSLSSSHSSSLIKRLNPVPQASWIIFMASSFHPRCSHWLNFSFQFQHFYAQVLGKIHSFSTEIHFTVKNYWSISLHCFNGVATDLASDKSLPFPLAWYGCALPLCVSLGVYFWKSFCKWPCGNP